MQKPNKADIWTRLHRVLRGLPVAFSMLRNKSISNDQFFDTFEECKISMDKLLEEAQIVGSYYSHYVDLIHSMFMQKYILFCSRGDGYLPSDMLESYFTQEKENTFFYHMQFALLDLTEAELNRSDIPNAPPINLE